MKHLYFVRHGLSLMNESGIFSGRTETPLHDDGKDQAKAAGQMLKGKQIDCIVASPLGRALETATIIANEIGFPADKIITNELFTERDFGPLEGTPFTPNLGDADGVESIAELRRRGKEGFAFLKSLPYETVLVVSHGAIGRALRHNVDPSIPIYPSEAFYNAQVVKLV